MGKKQREIDKHAAGAQGKSARKGHVEPDKSGNQPSQRQPRGSGCPARAGAMTHSGVRQARPGSERCALGRR